MRYVDPVATVIVGPTPEGVYPTESFSATTGKPSTWNVPGWVVTLIHGVSELKVVPLNEKLQIVPSVRPCAWNDTVPVGALRSTRENNRSTLVSAGTTIGLAGDGKPKY